MVTAWVYNIQDESDQRTLHKYEPNRPISSEELASIGVLEWNFDPESELEKVYQLMKDRNYASSDQITISKEKLANYNEKLKIFFTEHLHDDEEIRYILDGSGFFDIRDKKDCWIRIHCLKGDMIILPAGSYHRFTLDESNFIKAMRLFKDDVNWTPINRCSEADLHPVRKTYLSRMRTYQQEEEEEEEDSATSKKLVDNTKMDVRAVSNDDFRKSAAPVAAE